MVEHHASSGLVDVLSAMSARADEGFLDVCLTDTQLRHALRQLRFFLDRNRKRTHGRSLNGPPVVSPEWDTSGFLAVMVCLANLGKFALPDLRFRARIRGT